MKLWIRILCLVLGLMLSGVLAACGNTPAGPSGTDTETQAQEPATGEETGSETEPAQIELNDWLNEDGTAKYTVVWPDGSRLGSISAKLRAAISTVCGAEVKIITDWVDRGTEPPADNYEILYEPATVGGQEFRAIMFEDNIIEVCY